VSTSPWKRIQNSPYKDRPGRFPSPCACALSLATRIQLSYFLSSSAGLFSVALTTPVKTSSLLEQAQPAERAIKCSCARLGSLMVGTKRRPGIFPSPFRSFIASLVLAGGSYDLTVSLACLALSPPPAFLPQLRNPNCRCTCSLGERISQQSCARLP
jgi:hypothetical protein